MRNTVFQLCLVLIGVSSVHAVKLLKTSSLHVKVFPAVAIEKVWAVQGKDSLAMTGIDGDYYISNIHPGIWRVRVDAKTPYQDASFKTIDIAPGKGDDMGEIQLQK
jgi:hypothetical protein